MLKLLIPLLVSQLFGLGQLHEAGFTGQGVKVAIIDGGFFHANDSSIFPQNQILGVYDLLQRDSANRVNIFSNPVDRHGTMCLSTMLYRDTANGFVGTAPDATFYLIRSEDNEPEYKGEVSRLAEAFRLADSLDVDVVSVSLGYRTFDDSLSNFVYSEMDGRSEAAQAALQLARHGRLVCVAMGNDGASQWHYLSTPADADSILSVGACKSDSTAAPFSSYGPAADGRPKPEVCALGYHATVYNPAAQKDSLGQYTGLLTQGNGTSFATPEIAGMMACLRQALPDASAMLIRQKVMESASLFPNWDAQLGYGIPNAWDVYNSVRTALSDAAREAEQQAIKRIENGQIIIIRDGRKYDVMGRLLE